MSDLTPEMLAQIRKAVRDAMPSALLSDDEHHWVKLAIQREVQSIAFRRAVIEKTIISLVWIAVIGIGLVLKEFFTTHGWKP